MHGRQPLYIRSCIFGFSVGLQPVRNTLQTTPRGPKYPKKCRKSANFNLFSSAILVHFRGILDPFSGILDPFSGYSGPRFPDLASSFPGCPVYPNRSAVLKTGPKTVHFGVQKKGAKTVIFCHFLRFRRACFITFPRNVRNDRFFRDF